MRHTQSSRNERGGYVPPNKEGYEVTKEGIQMLRLISREEGATMEEMKRAIGKTSGSVYAQLASLGSFLPIYQEEGGREHPFKLYLVRETARRRVEELLG